MVYRSYPPPPQLEPYVDCFWSLELPVTQSEIRAERVLPDGKTELLFHYGDCFENSCDGKSFNEQARGLFAGQLKTFTLLKPKGNIGLVAVRFKPAGAAQFFEFPLSEITDQVMSLDNLLGLEGRALQERILNAKDNTLRFGVLTQYLVNRLGRGPEDVLVRAAVRLIGNGETNYDSLARKIGLSKRQIERVFKTNVGISPAMLSRIFRFQKFLALAKREPAMKLIDVSQECGYYDQSHFIKEFKAFSGVSPSFFLAESHEMSDCFTAPE